MRTLVAPLRDVTAPACGASASPVRTFGLVLLILATIACAFRAQDGATKQSNPGSGRPAPTKLTNPREALRQAGAALEQARRVRYDFSYRGEGSLVGDFVGHAELERVDDIGGSRMRVRIRSRDADAGNVDVLVATDGEKVTLVDHAARSVRSGDLDGGGSALFAIGLYGVLLEFVQAAPMERDLAGSKLASGGTSTVNGRPCRVVQVIRPPARIEWCLDATTRLPLRQRWQSTGSLAPGEMDLEIANLELPGALAASRFRPSAPKGYAVHDADGGPVAIGRRAPTWTLEAADGSEVSLPDPRSELTVLVFWASWCSNCDRIMAEVEAIERDFGKLGVRVIGLSSWEQDNAEAIAYLERKGYNFRHGLGGETLADAYQLTGLPGLYVIDSRGNFALVRIGPAAADMVALRALVRDAATRPAAGGRGSR